MANKPISTVVFDFGGVVVEWDMTALFTKFFDDESEMAEFLESVLSPEQNLRCDLGTPIAQVVGELVEQFPHHSAPLEAWRDRWIETIPYAIEGTEDLIISLKNAGYKILGLSNFSAETFPLAIAKYSAFQYFDDIVLSGELGIAKPDPQIYLTMCERNDMEPGEAVFMDDSPTNVDGAKAVGMDSFLFTDADSAANELRSRGLDF